MSVRRSLLSRGLVSWLRSLPSTLYITALLLRLPFFELDGLDTFYCGWSVANSFDAFIQLLKLASRNKVSEYYRTTLFDDIKSINIFQTSERHQHPTRNRPFLLSRISPCPKGQCLSHMAKSNKLAAQAGAAESKFSNFLFRSKFANGIWDFSTASPFYVVRLVGAVLISVVLVARCGRLFLHTRCTSCSP